MSDFTETLRADVALVVSLDTALGLFGYTRAELEAEIADDVHDALGEFDCG